MTTMILMQLLLLMMILMLMQYYLSYPKKFNGVWKAMESMGQTVYR